MLMSARVVVDRRSANVPPGEPGKGAGRVAFEAFEPTAWNAVAPERRTPMQHHIWASAAARTLNAGRPLDVITVGSVDQPRALAPLAVVPGWPRRLRLLGAEELGEAVEVVYRTPTELDDLAAEIVKTGLPVSFGHYLEDTPLIDALRKAYRGRGLVVARPLPARAFPSLALDPSWVEPESHFSAGRRSDFRRMQRAAQKLGTVTCDEIVPLPADVAPLLARAIDIEARSWKGRVGTALAHAPQQREFFERYAYLAADAGILRFCFLSIGGTAVAMQIAAETDNRYWLFKIGYDEDFRRCSPGNLLLREMISRAAERGLASYEFLGKEADWTRAWTETARPIVALRAYPANLAGLVAAAADGQRLVSQKLALIIEHQRASWSRPRKSDGAS